jgi:hypothetical protein
MVNKSKNDPDAVDAYLATLPGGTSGKRSSGYGISSSKRCRTLRSESRTERP